MRQNDSQRFDDFPVFHVDHFEKLRSVFIVSNCYAGMPGSLEYMNVGRAMIVWHDHYQKAVFITGLTPQDFKLRKIALFSVIAPEQKVRSE